MKLAMGDLKGATKEYEVALLSLRHVGENGEFGKGIKALETEYKKLATDAQVAQARMKALNDEASRNAQVRHEKALDAARLNQKPVILSNEEEQELLKRKAALMRKLQKLDYRVGQKNNEGAYTEAALRSDKARLYDLRLDVQSIFKTIPEEISAAINQINTALNNAVMKPKPVPVVKPEPQRDLLSQQRADILKDIEKLYSKNNGKLISSDDIALMKGYQKQLQDVTLAIARMKAGAGDTSGAIKELKTSMNNLESVGSKWQLGGSEEYKKRVQEIESELEKLYKAQKNVNSIGKPTIQSENLLLEQRRNILKDIERVSSAKSKSSEEKIDNFGKLKLYQNQLLEVEMAIAKMQKEAGNTTGAISSLNTAMKTLLNLGSENHMNGLTGYLKDLQEIQKQTEVVQKMNVATKNALSVPKALTQAEQTRRDEILAEISSMKSRVDESKFGLSLYSKTQLADDKKNLKALLSELKKITGSDMVGSQFKDMLKGVKDFDIPQIEATKRSIEALESKAAIFGKKGLYTQTAQAGDLQRLSVLENKMTALFGGQLDAKITSLINRVSNAIETAAVKTNTFSASNEKYNQKASMFNNGTYGVYSQLMHGINDKDLPKYIGTVFTELTKLNALESRLNREQTTGILSEKTYIQLEARIKQVLDRLSMLTNLNLDFAHGIDKDNLVTKNETRFNALQQTLFEIQNLMNVLRQSGELYPEKAFKADQRRFDETIRKMAALVGKSPTKLNQEYDRAGTFAGVNVQTDAAAELRRVDQLHTLVNRIIGLQNRALAHTGVAGKFYTNEELQIDRNHLQEYLNKFQRTAAQVVNKDLIPALPSTANMFSNVNVGEAPKQAETLNSRVRSAKENARQLYENFLASRTAANKVRLDNAISDFRKLEKEAQKFDDMIGKSGKKFSSVINSLGYHAKWAVQGSLIASAFQLPPELFDTYRELEQAMAGVRQVMPIIERDWVAANGVLHTAREETNAETEALINLAGAYARSAAEVTEAAQLWGRGYGKKENANGLTDKQKKVERERLTEAGYSEEDIRKTIKAIDDETAALNAQKTTNELVRQSAILATVDNFSMAESVKGLEAILAAYNMRARSAAEATAFAGRAVDIVSKVAHSGQISAQDLVQGIEATGKAAEQAGISLEFLSAMIETGSRNTGKSGSEIGQAIKALTVGIHSSKGIKELKNFGIELTKVGKDGKQHLRSAQSVILDISQALQDGSKSAEAMLMAISGGRYQYSKISAIVSDQGELMRMWMLAANSNGFAKSQLDVQLDTINAKMKQVKASLQDLMQDTMNHGGAEILKNLIDSINQCIKGIKSFSGAIASIPKVVAILAMARATPMIISQMRVLKEVILGNKDALKQLEEVAKKVLTGALGGKPQITRTEATAHDMNSKSIKLESVAHTENTRATAQEMVSHERNTTALAQESKAHETDGIAAGKNAVAETASGTAAATAATEHAAVAAAETGEATAANAATAATERLTLAETAATAGLNLIVGAAIVGIANYLLFDDTVKKSGETIEDYTKITTDNIDILEGQAAELSKNVTAHEEMQECLEKSIPVMKNLRKEIDSGTLSKEKMEKKTKQLEEIQNTWVSTMAAAAKEAGEAIDTENMSYEQQLAVFKRVTDEKKSKLKQFKADVAQYYKERAAWNEKAIEIYQANLDSFTDWGNWQIRGLNIVENAYAAFFKFLAIGFKEVAGYHSWWANEAQYLANQSASVLGEDNFITRYFRAVAMKESEARAEWMNDSDRFANEGTERIRERLNEARLDKYKNRIDEIQAMTPITPTDYGGMDDETNGEYTPPPEKKKKSPAVPKNDRPELNVGTEEIRQAIHDALEFNPDLKSHGIDLTWLLALSEQESSLNPNAQNGDYKGLFQIGSYVVNEYGVNDPFNSSQNANAAANYISDLIARTGSKFGAMKQYFGATDDSIVTDRLNRIEHRSQEMKNNYNIRNVDDGYIYNQDVNISEVINELCSRFDQSVMTRLEDGCVEAALKMAAQWSPWAKSEADKEQDGVAGLYNDAQASGMTIVPYSWDNADAGDIIIFTKNGGFQHAGVVSGKNADGSPVGWDNGSSQEAGSYEKRPHIRKRPIDRNWQTPTYVIKTSEDIKLDGVNPVRGKIKGTSDNAKTLNTLRMGYNEILRGYLEDDKQRQQQRRSIEEASIKRDQSINGLTSDNWNRTYSLQVEKLSESTRYLQEIATFAKQNHAKLNNMIYENKLIQDWLSKAGVEWHDLSKEQQKQLLEAYKNQKGKDSDVLLKLMEVDQKYNFDNEGKSLIIEQVDNEEQENNLKVLQSDGYRNPKDQYEYTVKKAQRDYNAKAAEIKDYYGFEQHDETNAAKRNELQTIYNAAVKRRDELSSELDKSRADDLELIRNLQEDIAQSLEKINQIEQDSNLSEQEKTEAIKEQEKDIKNTEKALDGLIRNGSEGTREIEEEYIAVGNTIAETHRKILDDLGRVSKQAADAIDSAFEDLLIEGKSVREVVQGIVKDIAKIALKRMVYQGLGFSGQGINNGWTDLAFGAGQRKSSVASNVAPVASRTASQMSHNIGSFADNNKPFVDNTQIDALNNSMASTAAASTQAAAAVQTSTAVAETGIAVEQTGQVLDQSGQVLDEATNTEMIPLNTLLTDLNANILALNSTIASKTFTSNFKVFANGGQIPKFANGGFTNGLIKGAGTGTSDSILTYLANRGQFIATSNGEYIIKKKSVDKLGVGFFDMVNNHPEVMESLQKYANGGSLGVDMAPSMSPSAVKSYKSYTKSQVSRSNSRLEALMEEQIGATRSINTRERQTVSQPIILNTQADSASVLNALKKNPRALQSILGGQQRHGFR